MHIGTALSDIRTAAADQWDRCDSDRAELNALGPGVAADLVDIDEGPCCGRVLANNSDGRGQSAAAAGVISAWSTSRAATTGCRETRASTRRRTGS